MQISKRHRFEVFKRDGFVCQYCGRRPPDVVLEVDHIHPQADGGVDDSINLITSCEPCNRGKSDRLLGDIRPRPDADLAYLEGQQEIAEIRRYMVLKEERDKLRESLVDIVHDVWLDAMPLWTNVASDKELRRLICFNEPDHVERAIEITGRKVHSSPRRWGSADVLSYIYGVLRGMREDEGPQK